MSRSRSTLAAMAVVALWSWSCGSTAPRPAPEVAAVLVTPITATLAVDGQLPLRAEVRDRSGAILTDAAVTWTVQNADIVSVSPAGVVRALALGTSQVAANALGKSGIAVVTVDPTAVQGPTNPGTGDPGNGAPGGGNPGGGAPMGTPSDPSPGPVESVAVTAPSKKLEVGDSMQLAATAQDARGNALPHESFVWSSSDSDKASVSASGLVTGKRQGDVTITAQAASAGGKSGSVDIEVRRK